MMEVVDLVKGTRRNIKQTPPYWMEFLFASREHRRRVNDP
jgi:hypothetical protein